MTSTGGGPVRVHLIDGTYELFRAHYSKRPERRDPAGRDVKATAGVLGSLLALLEDPDDPVTHVAVAFDNPIESFRNERFAGYKDGSGVDPALLAQFDLVERAVAALGVAVWSMREFEADDALATAAATLASQAEQVLILTPDKDLGQCVVGTRVIQVDRSRERTWDEEGVRDRLGVPPPSVPDLLALLGDTADGIPGLPGFGARTAAAVIGRYGHLESVPRGAVPWDVPVRGGDRLRATLAERWDDALLYRDLATLRTDVPIDASPEALAFAGVPRTAFTTLCDELGADTLRERPSRWA